MDEEKALNQNPGGGFRLCRWPRSLGSMGSSHFKGSPLSQAHGANCSLNLKPSFAKCFSECPGLQTGLWELDEVEGSGFRGFCRGAQQGVNSPGGLCLM